MSKIKDFNNKDLADWFHQEMFKPDELKEIKQLLEKDIYFDEEEYAFAKRSENSTVLYGILLEINKEIYINKKNLTVNHYHKYYLNESNINESQFMYPGFNDSDSRTKRFPISITRAFFISVYIYYQNKNSPLMKYREEVRDNNNKVVLSGIPFTYDLTGAVIESELSRIIFAPARIEPRIQEIIMSQNLLRGEGLLELSKVLIFNKNIKIVDFHTSAIKSKHINYLVNGLGLFDINSLEELNVSCNYLREDSKHFLSKLISHLKGLKSLNLSSNDLKNGVCSFFVALNKLYKENQALKNFQHQIFNLSKSYGDINDNLAECITGFQELCVNTPGDKINIEDVQNKLDELKKYMENSFLQEMISRTKKPPLVGCF